MRGYWSVFVHLIDAELEACQLPNSAARLAQVDSMPQGGRVTFPAMIPETVYEDLLLLPVPAGLDPSRALALNIGLYDARSGVRPAIRSETVSGAVRLQNCAGHIIKAELRTLDATP
jgi:hypothetical protein